MNLLRSDFYDRLVNISDEMVVGEYRVIPLPDNSDMNFVEEVQMNIRRNYLRYVIPKPGSPLHTNARWGHSIMATLVKTTEDEWAVALYKRC